MENVKGMLRSIMRNVNSLFFKTLAIVFGCVMVTISSLEVMSYSNIRPSSEHAVANKAASVTNLISMQIGGSVKFGNVAAIEEIVKSAATSIDEAWLGALITNASGKKLMMSASLGEVAPEEWSELVQTVLETGVPVFNENGLLVAHPIFFGDSAEAVGVVVSTWSAAPMIATATESWTQALIWSVLIFFFATIVAGIVIRRIISAPLVSLETAVSEVAGGSYDITVPHSNRGDEIGQIARRLEDFRSQLKLGAKVAEDSAYQSAAFAGSTAAMLVVNRDFEVIYCNPACICFFESFEGSLASAWKNMTPSQPVGASLMDVPLLAEQIKDIRERETEAMPQFVTLPFGESRIRVKFNAALDADGVMSGAVVEWSDRTAAIQNTALVEAIDSAQMRAEFSANGVLLSANENFLSSLNKSEADLSTLKFGKLFIPHGSVDEQPLKQEAVSGRFLFAREGSEQTCVTDGSFVAVKGLDGQTEKNVFVGMDVTKAAMERQSAEKERLVDAESQQRVVDALGNALTELSSGDLTSKIVSDFPSTYEKLRIDFNSALASLDTTIGTVAQNAASIRSETSEITTAADDLSRRTERQAATLEETAAALDELTSSVRSAAEGAQGASEKAHAAQTRAEEGGSVAKQAVTAMDGIKSSSQEISKITSVIDDIAFQTNLLALNAGVEAARAGEAGRGFAVVATEVRALAQRSSDAAREINELISTSEEQVNSGVELVDKTGSSLAAIVSSISEISDLVSNIALSTKEQASGLNEVNSAVNELDQVTQQNAAMFEETTAASHALTSETDALAEAISQFKIGATFETPPTKKTASVGFANDQKDVELSAPAKSSGTYATNGSAALDTDVEDDLSGWEDF
ncbi:MAG: methyl-accepting chemotaxis protein [Aliishimia sp.]